MTLKIVQRTVRTHDSSGEVVIEKQFSTPALICDHCQREIDSAHWGVCTWRAVCVGGHMDHPVMKPVDEILYHVHKGSCWNAFTAANEIKQGDFWNSSQIEDMLGNLIENAHVMLEQIESANPRFNREEEGGLIYDNYKDECADFHEKYSRKQVQQEVLKGKGLDVTFLDTLPRVKTQEEE